MAHQARLAAEAEATERKLARERRATESARAATAIARNAEASARDAVDAERAQALTDVQQLEVR